MTVYTAGVHGSICGPRVDGRVYTGRVHDHLFVCNWAGINYYEEEEWAGQLPEGVLSTPRESHGQSHVAEDSRRQLRVDGQESTDDTVREKIADKWNDLKMFCCRRRRESIQPEIAPRTGAR